MKKERLFYLDFVRAAATLLIVLTHYNALFLYTNPQMPEKSVLGLTFSRVYIGDLGVSLFLIISGASLMYVYKETCDLRIYFKKRFWGIYPMFWLGYAVFFFYNFYQNQGLTPGIPKYRIIYSILGLDMYAQAFGQVNFAIVGEWFLGMIILFYPFFPLFRKWALSHPVSLAAASAVLYAAFLIWPNPHNSIILPVLLPRIIFGMLFIQSGKKVRWSAALISAGIIVLNFILPIQIDSTLQATYIGIAVFLILVWLADFLRWIPFRRICGWICKYSYAIFIVHHTIIFLVTAKFDLYSLTRFNSYLLFLCCCCVIFVAAYLLQKVHDRAVAIFRVNKKE
ncbi:MAG TPA: acyltransferase [Candidatus Scatomonas merdigallinarum]|nr:acyltransferase [Candidatus Scatomonas merdigallinarum]